MIKFLDLQAINEQYREGIDLSVPAAPTNAIAPVPAAPAGGIPASAPSAPQPAPLFPTTPAAPATEPTPAEKK